MVEEMTDVPGLGPAFNTEGLLRFLFELDLDDVGKPDMREMLRRFQQRGRAVIAAEPLASGRTVGEILLAAWGDCPAFHKGKMPEGEPYSVPWGAVCDWLDRPLRLVK